MVNVLPVRSRLRAWTCCLMVLGLTGLSGCARSLDTKVTEKTLKEQLSKQGVGSLKQVSCPGDLKAGQKFECIGIFESGIGFKIPVEQKGEGDQIVWEIPTIKGMLNMKQVLNLIQGELKLADGSIDCGTSSTYRMATLGSTFECTVTSRVLDGAGKDAKEKSSEQSPGKETQDKKNDKSLTAADKKADPSGKLPEVKGAVKPPLEPDKIEIAIASSGDVTWQRMVAGAPGKGGQIPTGVVDTKGSDKQGKGIEAAGEKPSAAGNPDAKGGVKNDGKADGKAKGTSKEKSGTKPGTSGSPAAAEEETEYDS
jgi:hypothetical protein